MKSKPPGNARACVAESLLEWESNSIYARDILDHQFLHHNLEAIDRGLATELFYGVLRNLSFLDKHIAKLRNRGSLKRRVRNLLRLGLYQIFKTEIADHAAVNETVSLAKKHERGLVNAILRTALREKDSLVETSNQWPDDLKYSHPKFLIQRWRDDFDESTARSLCEWNNQAPSTYARIQDEEAYHKWLSDTSSEKPTPVDNYPEFVKLPSGPVPKELLDSGALYIQDPSTSVACWLLAPQPDELILDACAAPGGKTSMLWSMAANGTKIVASDSNASRIEKMQENFQRLEMDDVDVHHIDWLNPTAASTKNLPKFDAILLDVPCSNTGVMRRRIDVRWRLRNKDFKDLADLQLRLLKNVMPFLKPTGRIIYSTCSIDPEENLRLVESSGLTIEETKQTLPWRDAVDGAFAAKLRATI